MANYVPPLANEIVFDFTGVPTNYSPNYSDLTFQFIEGDYEVPTVRTKALEDWFGTGAGISGGTGFFIPKLHVAGYSTESDTVEDDIRDFLFSVLSHLADLYHQDIVEMPSFTATGEINGTTLSLVEGVVGVVEVGQKISGRNVLRNTLITQGSGLVWTVDKEQTVASTLITGRAEYKPDVYVGRSIDIGGRSASFSVVLRDNTYATDRPRITDFGENFN